MIQQCDGMYLLTVITITFQHYIGNKFTFLQTPHVYAEDRLVYKLVKNKK